MSIERLETVVLIQAKSFAVIYHPSLYDVVIDLKDGELFLTITGMALELLADNSNTASAAEIFNDKLTNHHILSEYFDINHSVDTTKGHQVIVYKFTFVPRSPLLQMTRLLEMSIGYAVNEIIRRRKQQFV